MTPREQADLALADLAETEALIAQAEAGFKARLAEIEAQAAAVIGPLAVRRSELDKGLVMLMKTQTADLFDGRDKLDLDHGVLLHSREPKVSVPRDALPKIEAAGWAAEAVQVVKTVLRGVVEKWPDEKLAVIGAARKLVDSFSYELKP